MTRHIKSVYLALSLFSCSAWGGSLTLDGYMSQVSTKHEGLRANAMVSDATEQRAGESNLPMAWTLNAGVEKRNDYRRAVGVQFQNEATLYNVSVSKLTSFGLNGKLGLSVNPLQYINVAPAFSSFLLFNPQYDVATTLELTQSLWRNGFGRTTRAQKEVDEANAMAVHFKMSFAARQIRQQAENAYWLASSFQEIIRIQNENLERAEKMVSWSKGKLELDLADKADLLQAQSSLRLRELDLAQAKSDFKTACRTFNSLRGVDSDNVEEKLVSVYIENVDALAPPSRAKLRDDVAGAIQDAKAAYSNARLGAEKNKPTLEAYISYAVTGRDGSAGAALGLMTRGVYPYSIFGIRFSTPLHFGLLEDDKAAYLKEQRAAELNMSRKQFEQESDWKELVRKFGEGKEKLSLARDLEKAQSEKYHYEQKRLKSAKTTLFQVLQFEQDFALAQLSRIQRETEVRSILTQMKTFGSKS